MNWRKLLFPLSGLYWIGVSFRNLAFNIGLLPSQKFKIPVVCVGNLSVGGTGKSPHVMLVADILKDHFETAMLSRGYGRKTSGIEIANYSSKVYDIGDEPLQFFNRFRNKVVVAVSENRVNGINHLMEMYKTNAVLMDDGFQHRQVKPGFSILLTTYTNPYYTDYLLPAGNLREPRSGARRADVIVVTKCPDKFSVKNKEEILARIKPKPYQKVYFSKVVYSDDAIGYRFNLHSDEWSEYEVLLITGIANSKPFVDYVTERFKKVNHLEFSDHHNFSVADVEAIDRKYEQLNVLNKIMLTTEKDYMRLKDESALIENLFYLPIEVELDDYDGFKQNLLDHVGKIKEAVDFIQSKLPGKPEFAVVLGSGLGKLQDEISDAVVIGYEQIPNFPKVTVKGHSGKLIFGKIEGKNVLMMAGRFHYYEGYDMKEVTFPMRVFKGLGIEKVILSNASGGVNPSYRIGDAVVIRDHINMMPEHPLRGHNDDELGPRFVNMSHPYDPEMIDFVINYGKQNGIEVKTGVYMGLQGPTFETPAEYGMVRILGADCVGMSTVPEVIVANHQSMRVFCISVITDLGGPEIQIPVSHEEVLSAADKAMPKIVTLVKGLIASGV